MPFQASNAKLRLFIRCLNWQHKTVGNREGLRVTENNAAIPSKEITELQKEIDAGLSSGLEVSFDPEIFKRTIRETRN